MFQGYRENVSNVHFVQNLDFSNTSSKQVIVPEMRFDCVGSITSWSAHTLVLTLENFLEFLGHTITFQVWRPSEDGRSYMLVGSNVLTFQGQRLRDGITRVLGRNDVAYFSFTESISISEQISFIPGDVVGWYYTATSGHSNKPLSILYTDHVSFPVDIAATLLVFDGTGETCVLCNVQETSNNTITSVMPLVSAGLGESSCVHS